MQTSKNLLAICILIVLSACSQGNDNSSDAANATPMAEQSGGLTVTPTSETPTGTTRSCSTQSSKFSMLGPQTSQAISNTTPVDTVAGPDLVELDAFQVVAIALMNDSKAVSISARAAPLIADRAAVVRAKVVVPSGWTPAKLELRVDVTLAGVTTAFISETLVTEASDLADPNSGLFIELPANMMQLGATYAASLWESGASLPSARFPQTGENEVGVEVTGPVKVHVVPYKVADLVPDTSQAVIDGYCDVIFAYYPTAKAEVTLAKLRNNASQTGDPNNVLGSLLVDVGQLIDSPAEMAPTDTYYYALHTVAGERESYTGSTGTSQELDYRAGFIAGVSFEGDALNESTLVHELGHLHYLLHAPCGSAPDVDVQFPHANGMANTEGYDVRTGQFLAEDEGSDVMSYCQPRWVSAYHYSKMADWIQYTVENW